MAANRKQTMGEAFATVWSRGGLKGFYQGLIPWVSNRSAARRRCVAAKGARGAGDESWKVERAGSLGIGRDRQAIVPCVTSISWPHYRLLGAAPSSIGSSQLSA